MATAADNPLPAFIFASWLSFLVPASYVCVHGPDVVADALFRAACLLEQPSLIDTKLITIAQNTTAVLLVLASAILFSGYLLYSFAPPANGSRTLTYVGAFVTSSFCTLLIPFSAWVWNGVWETRMAAGVFPWLGWMLYLRRGVEIDRTLNRPFVLFFRRFDSFADLSILPNLLRSPPRGAPVVMLVSGTENEIGYWDPVKLMTYGVRANIPWGGRPVFLKGGDDWEYVMESLVARASIIVLDRTEKSASMSKEVEAVSQAGRPVIFLLEAGKPSDESPIETDGHNVAINYNQCRRAFVMRAAAVVVIVAITAYLVELPRQIQEKAAQGELWSGLLGGAIMLGFVSALSGGLLLRRGLTRQTRQQVSGALQSHLSLANDSAP